MSQCDTNNQCNNCPAGKFAKGDSVYSSHVDRVGIVIAKISHNQVIVEFPGWVRGHDGSGNRDCTNGELIPGSYNSSRYFLSPDDLRKK